MPSSDSEPGSRRGRTHDAMGAREAILNAAEAVFAEHGFDGARIDAIAKQAGYNKSLIFQYFDSKLGLYNEVIRRADAQVRGIQTKALEVLADENLLSDRNTIEALLGELVGTYFDYLVAHPRVARIYNWEMAEGWQTYAKIVSQQDYDDITVFTPILEHLQATGLMRSSSNPMVHISAALFVCHNFLGLIPMYRLLMPNADLTSAEALADTREHIIEFIVHGLLADSVKAGV